MKKKRDNKYIFMKKTGGEKVVHSVFFVIFAIYAASLVFPLIWLVIQTFFAVSGPYEYETVMFQQGPFALPEALHFDNYVKALTNMKEKDVNLLGMFGNSAWFIIIAETWCLFWPVMTGYIFSKYNFKGKGIFYTVIIFTLTIPIMGTTGAMLRLVDNLGIYDKGPLFVIVTGINGFSGAFLIYYGIFKGISWDYAEAVFVDGGGNFTAFARVMLPQALPAIAAMMVSGFILYWNEYSQFLLYMPSTPPVAAGLYKVREFATRSDPAGRGGKPVYYAGLVITTIPVLIIYGIMADKMMTNLSIGGLKG